MQNEKLTQNCKTILEVIEIEVFSFFCKLVFIKNQRPPTKSTNI